MAGLGEFDLSLLSMEQKTSLSLASINFDFALIKYGAPMEYDGVGKALTSRRREEAEDGLSHVTARKLAALFTQDADFPDVPNLIAAYGKRASEIASKHSTPASGRHGIFAEHVGLDATSIWAAATSGKGAIPIHLLACLLARIFSAPEAISIWTEIVETRKDVLKSRIQSQSFHSWELAAARISISRDQLSMWDASARAWVQSADVTFLTQQKQARLIIQGFHAALPSNPDIFAAIKQVWYQAMETLDGLIVGIPYNVQKDSAILLGLLAWHLYPDMEVIGETVKSVYQKDHLISAGGVVTVGMISDSSRIREGLSWSLPLSRLRYYGKPVVSSGAIDQAGSRVSFREIMIVNLGIITRSWYRTRADLPKILNFLIELRNYFHTRKPSQTKTPAWIELIGSIAEDVSNAIGEARTDAEKLIEFGRRVQSTLSSSHPVAFGLGRCEIQLLLVGDSVEDKVAWLRKLSFPPSVHPDECLIVYTPNYESRISIGPAHGREVADLELATLSPQVMSTDTKGAKMVHRRWIPANELLVGSRDVMKAQMGGLYSVLHVSAQRFADVSTSSQDICGIYTQAPSSNQAHFPEEGKLVVRLPMAASPLVPLLSIPLQRHNPVKGLNKLPKPNVRPASIIQSLKRMSWSQDSQQSKNRDDIYDFEYDGSTDSVLSSIRERRQTYFQAYRETSDREIPESNYFCLCSFSPDIAIYQPGQAPSSDTSNAMPIATLEDVTRVLQNGAFEVEPLEKFLTSPDIMNIKAQDFEFLRYLDALVTASRVYSSLDEAYVELSIVSKPLGEAKWATEPYYEISRSRAFSCVAWFENNGLNIEPEDLQHVMAISVRDSLFVAETLVRDPYDEQTEHVIRRAVGNVGRSGIAFLVSPNNLMTDGFNYASWRQVNHAEYDGKVEDNFKGTTLHLGFTGYELPLDTGDKGLFDVEAFFLETVVRAFDRGKWVADIDPLVGYENSTQFQIGNISEPCTHNVGQAADFSKFMPLSSIDNWNELLDQPNNSYVVRANGNWLARLAITALEMAKTKERKAILAIARDRICWACLGKDWDLLNKDKVLIIVC